MEHHKKLILSPNKVRLEDSKAGSKPAGAKPFAQGQRLDPAAP